MSLIDLLEGKAEEDFKDFFFDSDFNIYIDYKSFEYYHPSMQWGVLVDFADSVGCVIETPKDLARYGFNSYVRPSKGNDLYCGTHNSPHEAREAAIKKFVRIYNEQNRS